MFSTMYVYNVPILCYVLFRIPFIINYIANTMAIKLNCQTSEPDSTIQCGMCIVCVGPKN